MIPPRNLRGQSLRLLVLLLLPLLVCLPRAQAATGASIPTYAQPVLHIPRIDVEGLGAMEVDLMLEDPKAMTFAIAAAKPAAAGLTPGATYSLQGGALEIPLLRVGASNYKATFKALGANRFQLLGAELANLPGQATYAQTCAACHGPDGLGGSVGVSLQKCAYCSDVTALAGYIAASMPPWNPGSCSGTCASEVASYINAVFNTTGGSQVTQTLAAVTPLDPAATLRKASLQLVSRLPTAAEIALVQNGGESGLRSAVDQMMQEPAFYVRLGEIFNDWLHTNRYLNTNGLEAAINLMDRYPSARWYDPGAGKRDADYTLNQANTNNAIATEPLQLINYVAKNDLPATEILTADYFMVNGYSAKSYGITNVTFTDEWNPLEFRPARLAGLPHAGILSSLMFLNRYPTSATNRNRGRSRVVYDLFLDVDILALDGERPDGSAVDIASAAPTMENEDCVKCHSLLDPVASTFQDWNIRGNYAPPRRWYTDMFQAGFAGRDLPTAERDDKLHWLGEQIAADPRFDNAMVRIVWTGLTGAEPLDPPGASATAADIEAYQAQAAVLAEIKKAFVADKRRLKTLVREIVLSSYWRANGLSDQGYAQVHAATGAAALLTPELLHRKLKALFGFEWRGPLDQYATAQNVFASARLLSARQYYQQIYGGIDSFTITERLRDPNGLMALVQERMANEMACYAVPNDFLASAGKRRLLPYVETGTTLATPAGQAAVRSNLQHLHRYLLGEELAANDPELEASYQLFATVLQDGQAKLGSGETTALPNRCMRNNDMLTGASLQVGGVDGRLRNDPNYTIRAWMAVVAYLLSDYRFLYE